MPGITIDQMTLDLAGMSEPQARRLAMGIADGLAVAGLSSSLGQVPTLRIDLTAGDGAGDADLLARRVVGEIVRQLRQM